MLRQTIHGHKHYSNNRSLLRQKSQLSNQPISKPLQPLILNSQMSSLPNEVCRPPVFNLSSQISALRSTGRYLQKTPTSEISSRRSALLPELAPTSSLSQI